VTTRRKIRMRIALVTISVAAIASGVGLAVTAQPANAMTDIKRCGWYAYNYNYWSDAAFTEWMQNGQTLYYNYARDQSFYYEDLFISSGC
jgi:hypothetical protein